MKSGLLLDVLIFSALFVLAAKNVSSQMGRLQMTSPAFGHNQTIPRKYTCQGEDINPPLAIFGIPEGGQKAWSSLWMTPTRRAGTGTIGSFTTSYRRRKLRKTAYPARRPETISAGSITAGRAPLGHAPVFFQTVRIGCPACLRGGTIQTRAGAGDAGAYSGDGRVDRPLSKDALTMAGSPTYLLTPS